MNSRMKCEKAGMEEGIVPINLYELGGGQKYYL